VEGFLPLLHHGSVFNFAGTNVASFRGTFEQKLDAKNRLMVPVKYRPAFDDGALLAIPLDLKPCVAIWLPGEYKRYTERAIEELPSLSPKRAALERFFFGKSQLVKVDTVGRIMLPNFLLEHAKLDKEVVLVGIDTRFELWSGASYAEHEPELLHQMEDLTAHVDDA
jgi:MraZ protein